MASSSPSRRPHMFRIPHIMRMANREAFQPHLFHLGPYAPEFFTPLNSFTPYSSRYTSHGSTPVGLLQTRECSLPWSIFKYDHRSCFRESMARDMTGDAAFESLVGKLSEGILLKQIMEMYPELPNTIIDAIPRETLARLFASSAVIIEGSALSLLELDLDLTRNAQQLADALIAPPTTVRHPFTNRRYAVDDAIRLMENQVPVSLLKLACETFCVDKRRLSALGIRFRPSDENLNEDMQLLVHVLFMCLRAANPFYVENQRDAYANQLEKTASWIERNPHRSVMAYIYDSLTGRLSEVLRCFCMPTLSHQNQAEILNDDVTAEVYRMMTASQLRRYGVTFHTCPDVKTNNIFKRITYDRKTRKLILPTMALWDGVQPFLCNLMAYEATLATTLESAQRMVYHVSSFVFFLDCLIDTKKDVDVLVEAGVLRNNMARSNASVAKLFDGLDKSMYADLTPEFKHIVNELRDACKGRWRRWWVSFKEAYWDKKPWLLISVAAATVLLVLTILQTFYTART